MGCRRDAERRKGGRTSFTPRQKAGAGRGPERSFESPADRPRGPERQSLLAQKCCMFPAVY